MADSVYLFSMPQEISSDMFTYTYIFLFHNLTITKYCTFAITFDPMN